MKSIKSLFILATICTFACNGTSKDDDTDTDTDTACEEGVNCTEDCTDGIDNDGDGATDCEDSDCADQCTEDCFDGIDNDGDTFVDCDDADCAGQCTEDCTDGMDNDGDGLIDCDDEDCDGSCPEVCDDGRDNDGDGLIDCDDEDCDGSCPEVCDDDRDNDGDGLIGCDDEDCETTSMCFESDCTDGLDNDDDGLIDCEDGDCADSVDCTEDCYDGVDNDSDGLADCLDDDCWGTGDCHPDGIIATIQGGTKMAVQSSFKIEQVSTSVCSPIGTEINIVDSGVGSSMYGTIQAKPRGATDWTTCEWEVGGIEFSHQQTRSRASYSGSFTTSSSFGPVTRNSVTVEPGCGVASTDTWFLPQKLKFDYSRKTVLTESGAAWYQATNVTTASTYGYTFDSSCGKLNSTWVGTYTLNTLSNGSSYLAYE